MAGNPRRLLALLWLRFLPVFRAAALSGLCLSSSLARERWNEINIGPFYVDFQSDESTARSDLDELEQVRWVLGGLLEAKDLPSLWPIRLILTRNSSSDGGRLVSRSGQFLALAGPGQRPPLGDIAGALLDANTPRLPAEAESGLRALFSTLQAHGSHVTWGGPVSKPDLAFARMQLFATKFEYALSFHVFVSALKAGSSIRVAEQNAFGKGPDTLETEAADQLTAAHWQEATVSGRPLDPKRDFGVHQVDGAYVGAYIADAIVDSDPKAAEAAYKEAIEAGGAAMPPGYEGLALIAEREGRDATPHLEDAMRAGSSSAPVYAAAAKARPPDEALSLLKKAAVFNPKWSEPVYQRAQLQEKPAEKETLLKQAVALEPRRTEIWIQLAQLQTTDGHALAAQGSWLRAEDSAATTQEKERIQAMHSSSESERLNAAEEERKRERESVRKEDERAQNAELARIKAAEDKANAIEAKADSTREAKADSVETQKPGTVVPWDDTLPKKTITGQLAKMECVKGGARLSVKDRAGRTVVLLLQKPGDAGLDCTASAGARRVTISYLVDPDEFLHTAGRVLTIQLY